MFTFVFSEPEAKERVLQKLSTRYPVEEVGFDTMMSIVTSCNELDNYKKNNNIESGPPLPLHRNPWNAWPILRRQQKSLRVLILVFANEHASWN